jgi:hypothetical protein
LGSPSAVRERSIEFRPTVLPPARSPNTPGSIQLEIEHDGVVLRVREDLDVDRLAQLISMLVAARRKRWTPPPRHPRRIKTFGDGIVFEGRR